MNEAKFRHLDKLRSAIYGLAVGVALGVPVGFMDRGSLLSHWHFVIVQKKKFKMCQGLHMLIIFQLQPARYTFR